MADIIEYTSDERPVYGFEILPEAPVGPGRTYRGGGYFTRNDNASWSWVSLWINGQRAVDARLLVGGLADWPARIDSAVRNGSFLSLGMVFPESELTLIIEPTNHRLLRMLGMSPEDLQADEQERGLFLDFAMDDEEPADDGTEAEEPQEEALPSFDVTLVVDGGLIAGFGAARGGPAIVMYDLDGEVLLQFAAELHDDLVAAGLIDPDAGEAAEWEDLEVEEEEVEEAREPLAPDSRWGGHYLAREEYREALEDFATYVPVGSPVLDIGCGTGDGSAELLAEMGYRVTGVDTWIVSLQTAGERDELQVEWGDVTELEYENAFAGAVAFQAFLHLDREDLEDAFASVRRSLNDNGVFLLVLDPAQELLSAPSSPDAPGAMDFISDFTHGEVLEQARAAGFEVLHDLPVEPLEDARDWEERGKGRVLILQGV